MKKLFALMVVVGVLFSCNKENTVSLKEQLVSNPNGWNLASIAHEISNYSNEYDHYTNVGNFVFYEDNTGIYTYSGKTVNFIYSAEENDRILIKLNYTEITDYSSPFLFFAAYYLDSYDDDFGSGWENTIGFSVEILTDYSLRWYDSTRGLELFILKTE